MILSDGREKFFMLCAINTQRECQKYFYAVNINFNDSKALRIDFFKDLKICGTHKK